MGSLFGKTPKPQPIEPPPPPEVQAPSTLADPTRQRRALASQAGGTLLTGPRGLVGGSRSTSGNTLLGQ
jgi:hypothetical protein